MRLRLLFPHILGAQLCFAGAAASATAWADPGDDAEEVKDQTGDGDAEDDEGDDGGDSEGDKKPEEKAAASGEGSADPTSEPVDIWDTSEDPSQGHHFIGMRFRDFIVPKFMFDIFGEGGETTNAFSFGPEYVYRRDHLQYAVALWYVDYSMDPILMKGNDDLDSAYERTWSDMKAVFVTFDLLYEIPFKQGMFALLIGAGVGIGGVFGNIYRNQVYPASGNDPTNPDTSDLGKWNDCVGANNPDVRLDANHPYCDSDNEHYPSSDGDPYSEPSWANGGSKPFIFPYLSIPQISFRVKPMKHLNTRIDTGFSITGFYLGMAAHYGF